MKLPCKKYRIVHDKYLGYEVQVKVPFIPMWFMCYYRGIINNFSTKSQCIDFISSMGGKYSE